MDQRELRGLRTYALYCIVAAALLAVVFLFYFSRTKQNIQEQAEAQLTEVTRQYANAIKTDVRGNIQAVEALAHVFGELGQSNPRRSVHSSIAEHRRHPRPQTHGARHPRRRSPHHGRPDLRRPGPPLSLEGAHGPPHRRHPARGQDRQQPASMLYVSPIVHKGNVLGALFATVRTGCPSSCPSTTACSTARGRCSSPTTKGTSCSGEAARSSSAATTISQN